MKTKRPLYLLFLIAFFIVLLPRNVKATGEFLPLQKGDILIYQHHAEDQALADDSTFRWQDMPSQGHINILEVTSYEGCKVKIGVMNWEHSEMIKKVVDSSPYIVGKTIDDPDRGDHMYCDYVEKMEDVTVPAGTFKNCFKVVYMTCPDETAYWYCPGVGIVKSIYHHHGTIINELVVLKKIKIVTKQQYGGGKK